jgi:hypothetical protein
MKSMKAFVALKATNDDCAAIEAIRQALRQRDPWATRADVLRFALQAGAREVQGAR